MNPRKIVADMDANIRADRADLDPRYEIFTDAFIACLKTAGRVVDVGAEFGFYVRLSLRYGPPGIRITAIEPEPDRFATLDHDFGHVSCVTLIQSAVSDLPGTVFLATPSDRSPALTSVPLGNGPHRSVMVQATTLDEIVGDAPVDILKIDIEGAEDLACRGAQRLLGRKYPPVLFAEFHPASDDISRGETIDVLKLRYDIGREQATLIEHGGRVLLVPRGRT